MKLWTTSKITKIKILHKIDSKDLMIVALDLLKVYIQNMLGIMFSYEKWFWPMIRIGHEFSFFCHLAWIWRRKWVTPTVIAFNQITFEIENVTLYSVERWRTLSIRAICTDYFSGILSGSEYSTLVTSLKYKIVGDEV